MSDITITTDRKALEVKLFQLANLGNALGDLELDQDTSIAHVDAIVSDLLDDLISKTPRQPLPIPAQKAPEGYVIRSKKSNSTPSAHIHATSGAALEWSSRLTRPLQDDYEVMALSPGFTEI